MRTFKKQAAQGDLLLMKISKLPKDATPIVAPTDDKHILSHSETGHHHAIIAPPTMIQLFGSSNPLVGYMQVKAQPVELKHCRDYDTHEALQIDEGIYEIRRQREHTLEGWRRVED
jgi:hypothetical protein